MSERRLTIGDFVVIRENSKKFFIKQCWTKIYEIIDTMEHKNGYAVRFRDRPFGWTPMEYFELAPNRSHCFTLDQVES